MQEELNNLSYTIEKYNEVIEDSKLKISNLKNLYPNNYDELLEEKIRLESQINSVTRAIENPYFARIDFQSLENDEKYYIGKLGVQDFDNNIITIDWRAPIATLYYDSNLGKCSYVSPDGIIEGELKLKRQYVIEKSNLLGFNDVDTVANDELLKPYLNVSADNRLKNIVSTIQSEQNKIIREKISKNMIIQGVAGSGKTTVALHRIAYLVYNNKDIYKPSDYMVIGPNKFFVNYISNILPDLDVYGVSEYTLEELLEKYTNEKYIINNSLDKILTNNEISKYKTSLKIKNDIDNYFNNLKILPDDDFTIHDVKILSKGLIKNIFKDVNEDIYISIKSKIDRLILLISKYYDSNKEQLISSLISNNVNKKVINEFKNNFSVNIKKYFKVLSSNTLKIYCDILDKVNIDKKNILKKEIEIEDIPSLLYIRYKLIGDRIFDNYRHIVIDEAQDYGEFTFYVLNKIFRNSSFSIYGDIAQSLYSYRSIKSWDDIVDMFNDSEIVYLDKSYRTTIEIMNEANKINKKLNLKEAIPVIRHGDEVEYTDIDILTLLTKLKSSYETVAIITKTKEEALNLYEKVKKKIDINLITSDNLNYNHKVNILPSYLSKGLEFDSVIIIDTFDKNSEIDLKLLYVSMTRALHKLYINNFVY